MTDTAQTVRALFLAGQPHSITARPLSDDGLARLLHRMNAPFGEGQSGWKEVPMPPGPDYQWDDVNETWVHVPPPPPEVTEVMVRGEAGRRVELLVADSLPCGGVTWPMQVPEAEAYQADQTAPTPFLAARAAACGLTVAELAATVIAKRDALAAATGAVYGAMDVLLAMAPIPADFADDIHWPQGG